MSAQRENQSSTSQSSGRGEQRGQQSALARRDRSALPSLWMDPLDFVNPISLFRRMQEEINQVFQQTGLSSSRQGDPQNNVVWVPPVELGYRDGSFQVSVELPGVPDEDVTVAIVDNALVIQGERRIEQEENKGGVRRTELRYGQFYRAIPLPDGVNPDQARAELNNGVLRISLPVSQAQSNTREIPVQTGSSQQQLTGSSQQSSERTGATTQSSTSEKAA